MSRNIVGRLNDKMLREFDRLESMDPTDKDAMDAEIGRARAMQGLAHEVNQSARTILDTVKAHAKYGLDSKSKNMLCGE